MGERSVALQVVDAGDPQEEERFFQAVDRAARTLTEGEEVYIELLLKMAREDPVAGPAFRRAIAKHVGVEILRNMVDDAREAERRVPGAGNILEGRLKRFQDLVNEVVSSHFYFADPGRSSGDTPPRGAGA